MGLNALIQVSIKKPELFQEDDTFSIIAIELDSAAKRAFYRAGIIYR